MAQKIGLPHMFEFSDGLRALVTLTGRAPLCLKCGEVGHLRFGSPSSARVAEGPGQAFSRPAPRGAQEDVAPTAAQTFAAPAEDPQVEATPVKAAPVTEGVDVPPTVAKEVEAAPVQPAEVTEEPKVQSDDQMEEEWEDVRGRRSRSRSGEGRG